MKYKDKLHSLMTELSKDPRVRFVGYNTKYGHKMYGTLEGCEGSCLEMPVAENLIMGVAMGLSLEGFRPVVCVERSNFLLPMLDQIINHLYALPKMSGYQFECPVIIRVVIPTNTPLDCGIQHLGDYTKIIRDYTNIPVTKNLESYLQKSERPVCIVEYKELYETDYPAR